MNEILIALAIGIVAGILDVIPMIIQKRPKFTIYAMFAQWVFLGLVIPFINWGIEPWLKGLIIGILGMLPTTITVFYKNKKAVMPTIVFGGVFGMGIAIAGNILIG